MVLCSDKMFEFSLVDFSDFLRKGGQQQIPAVMLRYLIIEKQTWLCGVKLAVDENKNYQGY